MSAAIKQRKRTASTTPAAPATTSRKTSRPAAPPPVKSTETVSSSDESGSDSDSSDDGSIDDAVPATPEKKSKKKSKEEAKKAKKTKDRHTSKKQAEVDSGSEEDSSDDSSDLDSDPEEEAHKAQAKAALALGIPTSVAPAARVPSKQYRPPAGFAPAGPLLARARPGSAALPAGLDTDRLLEGEPDGHGHARVWHVSAPAGVSLEQVRALASAQIGSAAPVTRAADGTEYAVDRERCDYSLFLPTQDGYLSSVSRVTQSLNFRPIATLPAQAPPLLKSKPGHTQPAGLKMRYRPTGVPQGPDSVGNGMIDSDDSDEDMADLPAPSPAPSSETKSPRKSKPRKEKKEKKERKEKKSRREN